MATTDKDQVFIAEAIRVTTVVNSTVAQTGEFNAQTVVVHNGLDQSVAIQLQGSVDETNWIDIGSVFNVATVVNDYDTVTDYFPCYRVTAKCTVAPTTGDLSVWILKAGATT